MPPVTKRLSNVFSTPLCSPKLKPSAATTPDHAIDPNDLRQVGRQGSKQSMPCASQLFDMFKFMAGGNTDVGLAGGHEEGEEDELSGMSTEVSSASDEAEPRTPDHRSLESFELGQRLAEESSKRAEKERKTLGARFTALSLSNLIPHPKRSLSTNKHQSEDASVPSGAQAPSPETAKPVVDEVPMTALGAMELSPEEKLAAIAEEFGDIAGLIEGEEPERLLGATKGSLFKGVMMVGNLHLTTHRLLFHAIIPPESEAARNPSIQSPSAGEPSSAQAQFDVIHSGPVTIHRPGALTKSRRVWMELTSEMVTTYPSAEDKDLVRPLRCVLLTTVHECEPFDPDHPCDFYVVFDTADGVRRTHFTVDTEQSAIHWRRAFESALYRHAKSRWQQATGKTADEWTTMRCCLPLNRVRIKGISDYHSFATLIGLEVVMDGKGDDAAGPDKTAVLSGDLAGDDVPIDDRVQRLVTPTPPRRTSSMRKNSKTPASSPGVDSPGSQAKTHWLDSALPPVLSAHANPSAHADRVYKWKNEVAFNIGVFNEQIPFANAFESAVEHASGYTYKSGVSVPPLVFQVAGHDCLAADDDLELVSPRSSSVESDEIDGEEDSDRLLHETRKAEKAALAAKVFGLPENEPIWIKRGYVATGLVPARGHVIVTPRFLCFWRRNAVGPDIKYRFHSEDLKGAAPASSGRVGFHGMVLHLNGHRGLRFEFWMKESRDEVIHRINAMIKTQDRTQSLPSEEKAAAPVFESALRRFESPVSLVGTHAADVLAPTPAAMADPKALPDAAVAFMPFIANRMAGRTVRLTPRTFALLTIGSRGDVQPYIALGLRLLQDGHRVIIVTHGEFKEWVEGYGIEHRQTGGDPTALMKLSQEHKMFSPGFFKESLGSFRSWLDDLLLDSWNACHDADVLIESPSTMAGIHIAEALKIPYFRAFTMPWTRTAAYPHAFMVPAFEMGPSFNYSTYVLFDNIMWKATAGQINKWRKKHLGLHSTDMTALSVTKVPFLYNFSSAVVPKPLDWHDDIIITGYWELQNSDSEWSPSPALEAFMARAKEEGKPLVYIGFGSIVVPKPNEMTRSVIEAVEKADVRAIIAKGWSSRGGDPATEGEEIKFPTSCFGVEKIPHGWLFPKVQAALHHGGAGTVGASLRAGLPTLIKPWFGDQFFWAVRVTKLGVGLKVPSLRSDDLASALIKATTDRVMIEKAARIGEKIRSESGVDNALQAIHDNVVRAGSDRRNLRWAS